MKVQKRLLHGKGMAALLLALTLAACGGGGGGGGNPVSYACTGASEYDPIFTDGTTNYCAYGLPMIDAAAAYALGGTGAGVTVAVIDSGVDATHLELAGKISPQSIDIVRGGGVPGAVIDEIGHGTFVSGIIAAERNGVFLHGVAYGSTILAVRVDRVIDDPVACDPEPSCSVLLTSDIVAGVTYATSLAKVINLSLGGPTPSPEMVPVLIAAADAGAIIVMAAGNDRTPSNPALQPVWPAAYAGDATVNASGQLIAVAAVDAAGRIASFSNRCGTAKNFCLVAPGVNIVSTVPGEGFAFGSGTSFAAPYVSGAAAVLIDLFPTLAPEPAQVVQILLLSATDLGAPGVDTVYGHGLLNLERAVQPLGTLSVPLTDSATGASVDLAATALSLGPAFGDALSGNALIDRAFALDDFDRPYVAGLGGGVRHAGRGFGLERLRAAADVETVESTLPGGLSLAMAVSDAGEPETLAHKRSAVGEETTPALHGLSLSGAAEDGAAFRFGYEISAAQQLSGPDDAASAGLYWMAADMLNPHHGLVGIGSGLTLARDFGGATTASLGWVDQSGATATGGDVRIGELAMRHRFGGGASLSAVVAVIDESGGFLGSDSAGAFAVAGATSRVYTAGGAVPLGGGVEMIGSYTVVDATMESDGTSLLGDWGAVRADAFGLGVARRGVFGAGDRIGLLVGQPLRVSDAAVTLTAPVDYTLDKTVIQESERVSLVPSGREIDLQLAYDADLSSQSRISSWIMMQLEPGHVADADPAYGVGLRLDTRF